MNAQLDLAHTGRRDFEFLDLQNLWAAGLMKTHDFRHVDLLVRTV